MGRAIGAIGTVEVGLAERLADRSSRLDLPTLRRDHVGTTWRQRFSRLGEVWPMIRSAVRTAYVPGIGEITATEPEEIVASRPDEGPPHTRNHDPARKPVATRFQVLRSLRTG